MIDLSNVTAIALGADDVLQVQDSLGTVLWQKAQPVTTYNVSITAGSNGSVTVNGVSGNYSQRVAAGTTLTIEGTGDAGYDFDEWSDGVSTNPRTITVTGDLTLTASFAQAVMLNYFYVEDISGQPNTLSITKSNASAPTIEPYYSTDGRNWTSMGTTSTTAITATVPANGKLYLKATANQWGNSYGNTITTTGNHNVGGNIMSLLYGDNFEGVTLDTNYIQQFYYLFHSNTHLIDASDLELPNNVAGYCYASMFYGCTSLTTAPALPATTLTENCYSGMFQGCTSLTTAPALPATTLAGYCYRNMFSGCTSLTTAPALPATTLATYCYRQMFYGCTSLTTAPTLPATTLASDCYSGMFQGCTSLTTAPALPATTLAGYCYRNMFYGCTSLTTAPTLPATTLASDCYSGMFQGCTSLTTAPALPATTLAGYCYRNMFSGCTSLTTAPALPATTLATYCYRQMFQGCTLLNSVTIYANNISATSCLSNWLLNVAATGDFYALGSANWTIDSPNGVPVGWTLHHSLPVPCNVSISSNGNGSVSVNGVSGNYHQPELVSGTQLTLVATPDAGYVFDSWSDGDTNASRTVTITADTTLTASFVQAGEYFYVEDASGSSNTVTILKNDANAPTIEVFKSTDGTNWTSMGNTSTSGITATVPANGKLYLKATTNGWRDSSGQFYDHNIDCSGNFKIGGHIASLLFGDNYSGATLTSTNNYAFEDLFSGDTHLTDASDLVLPDTTAASCYTGTFENCTALAGAPVLPATTLADSCYVRMFRSCTSVNEIICYADTLGTDSTYQWLAGVASTGDFYKLGTATFASGASGIPTNWTTHNSL